MMTLYRFGAGLGLAKINPFVIRTVVQLKRASHRAELELWRALARAVGRIIEHYVCCALAGARWANPQDLAGGNCCDPAP